VRLLHKGPDRPRITLGVAYESLASGEDAP